MYYIVLQIGEAHPEAVSATMLEGRLMVVDGERVVRGAGGYFFPADDWRETREAAYLDAAERLASIAAGLGRRAERLRLEAAGDSAERGEG